MNVIILVHYWNVTTTAFICTQVKIQFTFKWNTNSVVI